MKTEFKIRSGGPVEKQEGAQAWWLTGPDPERWLELLVQTGIDRVPHSLHGIPDRDGVAGLLALAEVDPGRAVPGVTPCREVIPRVWIPAEAESTVAVRAADSERLPPGELRFVLPCGRAARLIESEAKQVGDLLVAPAAPVIGWNRAVVRDPFGLRLTAVIVPDLSTPEDLIKEAGEGIGKKDPKKLETLGDKLAGSGPGRAAGKVGEVAGVAALGALSGAAGALGKLGQALSGGRKGKQNLAEKIAQWASVNMAKLQERQDRTLDRLKDLLRRDPERGLEYALPLGDQSSGSRGLGPPSDSLIRRALNFDLSRLLGGGGGSPASPWQLSGTRWQELNRLYREAANREVRLGNYRRAAYIYAHLLSDYTHAAQVLRKGGYAREAAELYSKKLHHYLLAAECYVEAGMIDEAVALYEEHQQLMKLAGLYETLERFEDAKATYWRVTESRLHRGDHVGASEIVDQHLRDPERAIAILVAAWPSGPDAPAALTREFALRARERDHDGSRERADSLRKEAQGSDAVTLAAVLAATSGNYPDRLTAEFLEDATRLVSSKVLGGPNPPTIAVRQILEAVRRAGPPDRFRQRDTVRYLNSIALPRPFQPAPRTPKGQVLIYDGVKIVSERPVRHLKQVLASTGIQGGYVLAGVDGQGLIRVDCEWWHTTGSSHVWTRNPLDSSRAWLSVYQRRGIGGKTIEVLLNGHLPALESKQRGTEQISGMFTARGGVDSQRGLLATCHDEDGEEWELVMAGGSLSLSYQAHGGPQTFLLHGVPPTLDATHLQRQGFIPRLWVRGGIVIFTLGSYVGRFHDGRTDFLKLPGPVLEAASKPHHTRPAIALRILNGVWLIRPAEDDFEAEHLVEGYVGTLCFTSEGSLVMMGRDRIEVASVSSPAVVKESRRLLSFGCKLPGIPDAIFSTERRCEFAMVIRDQVFLCKLSEKRT